MEIFLTIALCAIIAFLYQIHERLVHLVMLKEDDIKRAYGIEERSGFRCCCGPWPIRRRACPAR